MTYLLAQQQRPHPVHIAFSRASTSARSVSISGEMHLACRSSNGRRISSRIRPTRWCLQSCFPMLGAVSLTNVAHMPCDTFCTVEFPALKGTIGPARRHTQHSVHGYGRSILGTWKISRHNETNSLMALQAIATPRITPPQPVCARHYGGGRVAYRSLPVFLFDVLPKNFDQAITVGGAV